MLLARISADLQIVGLFGMISKAFFDHCPTVIWSQCTSEADQDSYVGVEHPFFVY